MPRSRQITGVQSSIVPVFAAVTPFKMIAPGNAKMLSFRGATTSNFSVPQDLTRHHRKMPLMNTYFKYVLF